MDWYYYDEVITELPEEVVGFVYIIHYVDGRAYIGKKLIYTKERKQPLKGYKRVRIVDKKLPWHDYEGSHNKPVDKILKKEILYLCTNRRTMTYLENKLLFASGALENDKFVNTSIDGKFHSNCLDGLYF